LLEIFHTILLPRAACLAPAKYLRAALTGEIGLRGACGAGHASMAPTTLPPLSERLIF
jgi:hypothetical protein